MSEHISSQFNQELENIRTNVMKMGGMVEKQLSDTLAAIIALDVSDLDRIVKDDQSLNEMEVHIDQACQVLIARRQPAVGDLRMVLTVTRIITDLERMGDEIKKIALTASDLITHSRFPTPQFQEVERMIGMAAQMLHRALDAFARLDATEIVHLNESDQILDEEYERQFRTLVTYMIEDPRLISSAADLLFIKKSIERLGDHSKNIGEHVVYLAKGVDVRHMDTEEIKQIEGIGSPEPA